MPWFDDDERQKKLQEKRDAIRKKADAKKNRIKGIRNAEEKGPTENDGAENSLEFEEKRIGRSYFFDDERQAKIQQKLDDAKEQTKKKKLLEAHVTPTVEGVHIPTKDGYVAPDSYYEAKLASAFNALKKKELAFDVAALIDALCHKMKIQLEVHIDRLVQTVGVGRWSDYYADYQEFLVAAIQNLEPIFQEIGVEALPLLKDIDDELALFTFIEITTAPASEQYVEDMAIRGIVLDFELIATGIYRLCMLGFHQFILTAISICDRQGFCDMGKAGQVHTRLIDLWKWNIVEDYFEGEDYPGLFEYQPIRTFARTMAIWFRQRGWGSYI